MSPLQMATDLLRSLPGPVRRTIYTVLALIGLGLAACAALGVSDIGPISLERALQVYAYVSPAMGVVAVANVGKSAEEIADDFDEDVDLSAFEPVGTEDEVYGAAAL